MDRNRTEKLTRAALIAALYVVLTLVSQLFGMASGPVQFRLSEALTVLPALIPEAIPGLAAGCFLANMITGCALIDTVFGSLATLIGAIGTYCISKKNPWISPAAPVLANALIIPPVIMLAYGTGGKSWIYFALTVGLGEAVCCFGLGLVLYRALKDVIRRVK